MQHRIHGGLRGRRWALFGRQGHRALIRFAPIGIRKGAGHQRLDRRGVVAARFELFHQLRQGGDRAAQQRHHSGRARQCLVDDPIQEVLDRPAEFGDRPRANHAPAALQCMKTAADHGEGIQIHRILIPLREALLNRRDFLLGFLDEELQELRIHGFRFRYRNQRTGRRMGALGAFQRNGLGGIELHRLGSFAARDADARHARERVIGQRPEAGFGIVQHVPGIGAAALQRLHVVFDADDGVRDPLQADGIRPGRAGFDQSAHLRADRIHQCNRPALAQHQEARGDPAQQLRDVVEALRREITGLLHGNGNRLLDASQVHDALPEHRFADQPEFEILVGRQLGGRSAGRRQDQANELIIETVFDRKQDGGHIHQRLVRRRLAVGDDDGEFGDLGLDALPQLTQAQHPERIADFLQQLELRCELIAAAAAAAHEYVENILDLGKIFLDRRCDGAHQFHAGRREAFAFLFDRIVHRQKFGKLEGSAHRRDTAAGIRCPRDVVKEVVQQIDRRILAIPGLAKFVHGLDLPVRLAEQALQRRTAFQAVGADGFENGADHPPQLKDGLRGGDLLELFGDLRQNFQILDRAFAADVSQQADLKARPQAPRPLGHRDRWLAVRLRLRLRRLIGLEVEQ